VALRLAAANRSNWHPSERLATARGGAVSLARAFGTVTAYSYRRARYVTDEQAARESRNTLSLTF